VGFGFTHMAPLPFWRIDYVFYDEHFRGIDARILPNTGATDHLPLVVRLEMVEP
jgi:endonuclease/exonuclease/phosphatase (EEP) superfamily protein YafD